MDLSVKIVVQFLCLSDQVYLHLQAQMIHLLAAHAQFHQLRFKNSARVRHGTLQFSRDLAFIFDFDCSVERRREKAESATQLLLWLWRFSGNQSTTALLYLFTKFEFLFQLEFIIYVG